MTVKRLVVDHTLGEYELTNGHGVQRKPYRSRKVAGMVADFYKWMGYSVVIKKGRKMSASKKQKEDMDRACAESLWSLSKGVVTFENLNGMKKRALIRRKLVDKRGVIKPDGRKLMSDHRELADQVVQQAAVSEDTERVPAGDTVVQDETVQANGAGEHITEFFRVMEDVQAAQIDAEQYEFAKRVAGQFRDDLKYTHEQLKTMRSRLLALIKNGSKGIICDLVDEVEELNVLIDRIEGQS